MKKKRYIPYGVALIFVLLLATSPIYLRTKYPIGYVTSNSMYPSYKKGDIVIVYGKDPFKIEEGEVILFKVAQVANPILHRVVNKTIRHGTVFFRTKGDNNARIDPWRVPGTNVYGTVLLKVPKLGYVLLIVPPNVIRLATIIIAVLLVANIFYESMLKKRKENSSTSTSLYPVLEKGTL